MISILLACVGVFLWLMSWGNAMLFEEKKRPGYVLGMLISGVLGMICIFQAGVQL